VSRPANVGWRSEDCTTPSQQIKPALFQQVLYWPAEKKAVPSTASTKMSRKKKTKPTEAAPQHPPPQPEPNTRLGVLITPRTGEELGHPDSSGTY